MLRSSSDLRQAGLCRAACPGSGWVLRGCGGIR